jgi:hypothetical protein
VIFEPSSASAEACPPAVKVGGIELMNWIMSHRTVTPSALALETVNRGTIAIARSNRLFIYPPNVDFR